MTTLYALSAPVLVNMLTNLKAWIDKAEAEKGADALVDARLIEDMRPFAAQVQMASDSAKNGMARLAGVDMPSMPDTETTYAQLRERCDKTIAFVQSISATQLEGAETRTVTIKFPSGTGYQFTGLDYLTKFMLPNFFFHVTTAYAILRAQGVSVGKPDYLMHMGPPSELPAE